MSSISVNRATNKRCISEDTEDSPLVHEGTFKKAKLSAEAEDAALALASLASMGNKASVQAFVESRDAESYETSSVGSVPASSNLDRVPPVSPHSTSSPVGTGKRVTFDPATRDIERTQSRRFSFPRNLQGSRSMRLPTSSFARGPFKPRFPSQMWMPSPHMTTLPPGFLTPSTSSQQQQASSSLWFCDYCSVASFESYEDACRHEETCRLRCSRMVPSMWHHMPRQHPMGHVNIPPQRQQRTPRVDPNKLPTLNARECFRGVVPLAVPSDEEWLSEVNCYIRETCVEAFSATEEDASASSKRGRICEKQVGIRCVFCKVLPAEERQVAAVSYPSSLSGIYESVKRWHTTHAECCREIPDDVKGKLAELSRRKQSVPTTRQYWVDSARAIGMVDTTDGIRFGSDPSDSPDMDKIRSSGSLLAAASTLPSVDGSEPIVTEKDEEVIPPYVHFLMSQVERCYFTEADRFVARSKGSIGYPGFQCRYCHGHAGLGKYFPVSTKTLATNSTSQNIHAHILKCHKCPPSVKRELVVLKEEKTKSPRLEPGWRRSFFEVIWERLHGKKESE